jgi:plastocyanin
VSDGAGHFHILVDQEPLSPGEVIPNNEQNGYYHYGGGQTTAELDLDPGEHTVRLQAGDANHKAYELTDKVSVTAEGSTSSEQSTFTMNNVGSSAWEVPSADEEYVGTSGGENPTITLETGVRYTISNEGWSTHPLAFHDESGNILLSQSSVGEFENDDDINWSDDGDKLAFTLTDGLAAEVDRYICTVHNSMEGRITITESSAPADFPGSSSQYEAIAGDDEGIDTFDLVDAIDGASDDGQYNGADIDTFDFVDIIDWNTGS